MSREVDRNNPKNQDDLRYLAERDMLSPEWVEACGGAEGVTALLNGEKIKVTRPKTDDTEEEAEAEEEAAEPEAEEGDDEGQKSRSRARARS
jgi:hypothetical protein